MRTLLERWNNFIRGDRDGVCDSFFPRVARKAKRGPWQRWWTYLRRRHLQLGRTSFPVNSLWPGMQMLDSNTVKPAQKLWTLKMPWLTKLLLATGSSVNGWPPSLLLFPFLFFLHLLPSFWQVFPQPMPPPVPFLPPTQSLSPSLWAFPEPVRFYLILHSVIIPCSLSVQPDRRSSIQSLVYSLWASLAQALQIKEVQASKSLWTLSFPFKSYFWTLGWWFE